VSFCGDLFKSRPILLKTPDSTSSAMSCIISLLCGGFCGACVVAGTTTTTGAGAGDWAMGCAVVIAGIGGDAAGAPAGDLEGTGNAGPGEAPMYTGGNVDVAAPAMGLVEAPPAGMGCSGVVDC
jgi:hypothetical protein